mgnify:CR=1 FL=1
MLRSIQVAVPHLADAREIMAAAKTRSYSVNEFIQALVLSESFHRKLTFKKRFNKTQEILGAEIFN